MATPFRDWPWPIQGLFAAGMGVLLVVVGLYVPPIHTVRQQLEDSQARMKPLETEVAQLRVYQQRRVELQGEMDALQKQLTTLQTIVPEDKQADQFIIMLQGAAVASGVSIRALTTKPVVPRDYHFDMPFDLEVDGPYYAVLDFFTRLSRLSRIINIGDLELKQVSANPGGGAKFRLSPGTTVAGMMTVTTFFTKSTDEDVAAAAKATPAKH